MNMLLRSLTALTLCFTVIISKSQAVDGTFQSSFLTTDVVYESAQQADGKIVVAGRISAVSVNGVATGKIARLNVDGSIDPSFSCGKGYNNGIGALAILSDGKILIAGSFTQYNGENVPKIARLNSDGTPDNSFKIGIGLTGNNSYIDAVEVLPSGKILIGGEFSSFAGVGRNMLAMLNADGTLDNEFVPSTEFFGPIQTIAQQSDGKILIGGQIRTAFGGPVVMLRLNIDGSIDNTFARSSKTLNSVNDIEIQSDGKILVGGDFVTYGAESPRCLVRLNADGTLDGSFNNDGEGFYNAVGGVFSYPLHFVSDIVIQPDGKILVGGYYRKYNGVSLDGMARLNTDGTLENTFDGCAQNFTYASFRQLYVQSNGKIIGVGLFENYNTSPYNAVIRFNSLPSISLPPAAAFSFTTTGLDASFANTSLHAKKFEWDFGDGDGAITSNPTHKYNRGGTYSVRLKATGHCGNSTITKSVRILDLDHVSPSSGGNTGSVTLKIYGHGFTNESVPKLVVGTNEIIGSSIIPSADGKSMHASFDLHGQQPAIANLVVANGSFKRTLEGAFAIEIGQEHDITIEIPGRSAIRRGRAENIDVYITNHGNIDAKAVPIWLLVSEAANLSFEYPLFVAAENIADSVPTYVKIDSLFGDLLDERKNLYPLVVPVLPAQTTVRFPLKLSNTLNTDQVDMEAFVFKPIVNSPPRPDKVDCWAATIKDVIGEELDPACITKIKDHIGILEQNPCIPVGPRWEDWRYYDNRFADMRGYNICQDLGILVSQLTYMSVFLKSWGIDCLKDKVKDKTTEYIINRVTRSYIKRVGLHASIVGGNIAMEGNMQCVSDHNFLAKTYKWWTSVSSFDPNEKTGITGNNLQHYIGDGTSLSYTINFENLASASAPAQEVIVIDTLDSQVYDLSTFQFTAVGFNNKTTISIPGGRSYLETIDLRPSKNILVKIEASFDQVTGVAKWRFLSLDPTTYDYLEDPFAGFLPPNNILSEGEGFVSFSISARKGLATGSVITNEATIFFDTNEPIVTNTFINTVDISRPESGIIPLEPEISTNEFLVEWSGQDTGAGVSTYDVYYSVNGGQFRIWKYNTMQRNAIFTGKVDSVYSFISMSRDNAGNVELAKSIAESTTKIIESITGIEQHPSMKSIVCYPNPFRDQIVITFLALRDERVTIQFVDIFGRLMSQPVTSKLFRSGEHSINVQTDRVSAGLYAVKIQYNSQSVIFKAIKAD